MQRLAERMADTARERERHGDIASAFELARDAVLLDPRRSWMRRRAEDLRPRRLSAYDGGRDRYDVELTRRGKRVTIHYVVCG